MRPRHSTTYTQLRLAVTEMGGTEAVRQISYVQAIAEAQAEEMRRDAAVILLGEDLRVGIYGTCAGFYEEFGADRVLDTPISEAGFTGAAVGAAMTGMRPIVDYGIACFLWVAFDQVISQAAKNRYLFGGQAKVPIVLRATMYYNSGIAAQHSDRSYPMLMNMPGLKIVVPSTPYDAKGLLKSAIRDDDPVVVFEDVTLLGTKGPVPTEEYTVPLGQGDIKRNGSDVTIVAIAGAVRAALAAADALAEEGISAEVIDPRSLVPLDTDLILNSVAKTGKLVIVDPATRTCSAASEIAARVVENGFGYLKGPIVRVTCPDIHVPFSPALEKTIFPDQNKVVAAVHDLITPGSRGSEESEHVVGSNA